jgi:hypothetical protein
MDFKQLIIQSRLKGLDAEITLQLKNVVKLAQDLLNRRQNKLEDIMRDNAVSIRKSYSILVDFIEDANVGFKKYFGHIPLLNKILNGDFMKFKSALVSDDGSETKTESAAQSIDDLLTKAPDDDINYWDIIDNNVMNIIEENPRQKAAIGTFIHFDLEAAMTNCIKNMSDIVDNIKLELCQRYDYYRQILEQSIQELKNEAKTQWDKIIEERKERIEFMQNFRGRFEKKLEEFENNRSKIQEQFRKIREKLETITSDSPLQSLKLSIQEFIERFEKDEEVMDELLRVEVPVKLYKVMRTYSNQKRVTRPLFYKLFKEIRPLKSNSVVAAIKKHLEELYLLLADRDYIEDNKSFLVTYMNLVHEIDSNQKNPYGPFQDISVIEKKYSDDLEKLDSYIKPSIEAFLTSNIAFESFETSDWTRKDGENLESRMEKVREIPIVRFYKHLGETISRREKDYIFVCDSV